MHDPIDPGRPVMPLCGSRRFGWRHGAAIGSHRLPCVLDADHGTDHQGVDHRDAFGRTWPPFCEDCGTTTGPLGQLTISLPDGQHLEGHLCGSCARLADAEMTPAGTTDGSQTDRVSGSAPETTERQGAFEDPSALDTMVRSVHQALANITRAALDGHETAAEDFLAHHRAEFDLGPIRAAVELTVWRDGAYPLLEQHLSGGAQ